MINFLNLSLSTFSFTMAFRSIIICLLWVLFNILPRSCYSQLIEYDSLHAVLEDATLPDLKKAQIHFKLCRNKQSQEWTKVIKHCDSVEIFLSRARLNDAHYQKDKAEDYIAKARNECGGILSTKNMHKAALKAFDRALEKCRQKNSPLLATIHSNLGYTYLNLDSLEQAMLHSMKAVHLRDSLGLYESLPTPLRLLAEIYSKMQLADSVMLFYYRAIASALKSGDTSQISDMHNFTGKEFKKRGQLDSAYLYYMKAIEFNQLSGDTSDMMASLFNLFILKKQLGDIPQALDHLHHVQQLAEKTRDKKMEAAALNSIGLNHLDRGDFALSLTYFNKALRLRKAINHMKGVTSTVSNIGMAYQRLGRPDSALICFNTSLKMAEKINDKRRIRFALSNLAYVNRELGNYRQAEAQYRRCLLLYKLIMHRADLARTHTGLGNVLLNQRKYHEAITNLKIGFEIFEELDYPELASRASQLLSEAYEAVHNPSSALKYHKIAVARRDSVNNEEAQRATAQREAQYTYEKQKIIDDANHQQQLAIEQEKKEKQRIFTFFMAGGFILVALFLIFVFNQLKKTKRQNLIIENQKAEVEMEHERSDQLLRNILPNETAQELKTSGTTKARFYNEATVLFTDFQSFTEIAASMNPTDLVQGLHAHFSTFDTIVEKYKIEKIKTIGDAYMAVCGVPNRIANHAERIILAGLEFQQYINTQKQGDSKIPFNAMRIGIHTGPVVAGVVGTRKFQYDIWGDTVNTASRMEKHGEINRVNISQSTYDMVKDSKHLRFEFRGSIEAKGKGEMGMYFVERKG